MFRKSADIYDAIYLNMGKDYAAETKKINAFVHRYKKIRGNRLLDVACGTGLHIKHLRHNYQVEGLEFDRGMLKIARQNFPDIIFHHGDMLDFKLRRRFDVITCLFSSIGYVRTIPRLNQAIQNMSNHLKASGILIVEPWFPPEDWQAGTMHLTVVDQPNQKIVRINVSGLKGKISFLNFHYLVATAKGVKYFYERHELGLFTHEEYQQAFHHAGLNVRHDQVGVDGRGLYIASESKKNS